MTKALVTGSHLHSGIGGGPLDGAYGVVAAVEVAAALHGRLRHDLVVVAWSNDEGAGGTPGLGGSHAAVGALDGRPDRVRDVSSAAWDPARFAALVELHVEQGPVLETMGAVIGAVDGITGQLVGTITVTGTAHHAGTTPMHLRRDALVAAAEVVLAVEGLALDGRVHVATCGHLTVDPDISNAVPGRVSLSVDLRDVDDALVDRAWSELLASVAGIAARRRVTAEGRVVARVPAVDTDPVLTAMVERSAHDRGHEWRRLPSGARHDAQVVAALGPVAMVFVPSVGGVTRGAGERTHPDHLVAGAHVLADVLLAADLELAD